MRGARAAALMLIVALLAGIPILAHAQDQVIKTELMVAGTPEADGKPIKLDATILTTDPATPRPAVVLAHGFGGTKNDSEPTARSLALAGYTVIIYTARGFGASGGRIHLNNPAYEGADARKLIDLAASRPEVAKVGDDPVIGFAGASYGGAVSFLAAGLDQRVDAIAPAFTWHSLRQALFPQHQVVGVATSSADVTPANRQGVFKQRWAAMLFSNASGRPATANQDSNDSNALCGRFDPELCRGYLTAAETGEADDELSRLLDESGLEKIVPAIKAPTLIIQGEDDTLFTLDQADANFRGLPADTPAQLKWVAGGHDAEISVDTLVDDIEEWFGRYLKHDGSVADSQFSVLMPETSLLGEDRGTREPQTLLAQSYPGRESSPASHPLALSGERQSIIAPPGGAPAALTSLPGTGSAFGRASSVAGYALGVLPGQSARFTSDPLTAPLTLIGSSRIDLDVTGTTPTATLFASLWDLGPDLERTENGRISVSPSSAVLPQLQVAPVKLTGLDPTKPMPVTIALPPVSHKVPVGHRLQLVISTTDQAYSNATRAAQYDVALAGDRAAAIPMLATTALNANTLNVPLPLLIAVALLMAASLTAALLLWRRRREIQTVSELAGVPLVVNDVVKTYGDGFRAVDGVSFRAEAGQVVGLLGPNGAGKTTVIRMLVGLIRPDSGSIYVNGQPVHAGADVLSSVGAFIEGPGFLPHLSGKANLMAYWNATGRPLEEAYLDEALEIAGLGAAIGRKVRGYSHGMRQRLGIAQAMLGMPPLLVLDEPTNGLDPPQIKTMRAVLAHYTAAGRTVVISSHLLSEVEHTCSHVVVMDKGKVVLTGAVEELTASDTVTVIGLTNSADVGNAGRTLQARGLQAEPEGKLLRVTGELPRQAIVAELVAAGYGVESVDGHRQLEEVFMSIVGTPADGLEDTDEVPR
ncbi:MAG TPA: alpha/beta fold hydrolase [Propionibacteriaceae bacterium]|nr:alpha/beta fold hydrolase [Propionibacteriaceae bacterium]